MDHNHESECVRILQPACGTAQNGMVTIHGMIDWRSLGNLKTDPSYHSEKLPSDFWMRKVTSMIGTRGAHTGIPRFEPFPDIELGVRSEHLSVKASICCIHEPVFIIRGVKRVELIKEINRRFHTIAMGIGCVVFFGTTREWEAKRRSILHTSLTGNTGEITALNRTDNGKATCVG